jgi:DNA-binding transcriptional ArsR family regulator
VKANEKGFDALGDETRRSILEILLRGPSTVGDLAQRLPVSRSAVSQHLKVLKSAQLVRDRQNGTQRIYQLDPDGLARVRAYLEGLWSRALDDLKSAAESSARKKT